MKSVPPAFGVELTGPYYTEDKWVSPFNFWEDLRGKTNFPANVRIHDVTLRDGEQTARIAFTPEEKVFLAGELDRLGVASIEPGLPATPEDREVIETLSEMDLKAKVVPLVRVREDDVRAALEARADGMLLEFGINPYLLKYVYDVTPEELTARISEYARWGKEAGVYVEFMGWDVFRIPDLDYVRRFYEAILEPGDLDRITVSDTFGMAHPLAMYEFIRKLKGWFPGTPVGLHIHNDFGLATGSSMMAVAAGADEIHSSINGLGERAGNVATEEVSVALEHLMDIDTGVKLERLKQVSDLFAEVSKKVRAANKPIVGDGLFEVESGIVVHVMRQMKQLELGEHTLFPYAPQTVGHERYAIVAGRGSGQNSTAIFLEERGIEATPEQVAEITHRIKHAGLMLKNGLPNTVLDAIIEDVVGRRS
jgi:2-isopropylmalate synthase